jgi:aldehyde dehydrogenase (NAD+)
VEIFWQRAAISGTHFSEADFSILIPAWRSNSFKGANKPSRVVEWASRPVNVKNDMTIAQEEIFGPVLCVITYDSEDEAIRIANDSKYGLHSCVLGTDLQRARRVASQIRAGRVVINGMTDDPQAPWGGFKYSGFGREYGQYGIEAFLETRAILES